MSINLGPSVYRAGLAVTSHNDAASCTAVFSKLGLTIPTVHGNIYQLRASCAPGKCLDVSSASLADSANVLIWQNLSGLIQMWQAVDNGNRIWEFAPKHAPAKRLEVQGGGVTDFRNVDQFSANGASSQKWRAHSNADGTSSLEPLCAPGQRLEVDPEARLTAPTWAFPPPMAQTPSAGASPRSNIRNREDRINRRGACLGPAW